MYPMLDWFWPKVYDAGPTSTQHWKLFILSGRHFHFRSNPVGSNDIHDRDCIPDNHTEQRYINLPRKDETLSGCCLNVGGPTLKHYWFNVVSCQRRWSTIETTLVQQKNGYRLVVPILLKHLDTTYYKYFQRMSDTLDRDALASIHYTNCIRF